MTTIHSTLTERKWAVRHLLLAVSIILQLESASCATGLEGPGGIPIWQYHGALVTLGFLSLVSGALVARFKPWRWWLRAHRLLVSGGIVFTMSGLTAAAYLVSISTGIHMAHPHSYIGLTAATFALLTLSLGLAQYRFRSHAKAIRAAHRWCGRFVLILLLVNIVAGLKLVGIL